MRSSEHKHKRTIAAFAFVLIISLFTTIGFLGHLKFQLVSPTERPQHHALLRNTCSEITNEMNRQSLVIGTRSILEGRFSYRKTLSSILSTSGLISNPSINQIKQLSTTLLTSLDKSTIQLDASSLAIPTDVRHSESALSPERMLGLDANGNEVSGQGFQPIALFNRFDLAPADFSTCGEYRIIYALYPNGINQRFLVIFEGVLPNPLKDKDGHFDPDGCRPVVQFWTDIDKTFNTGRFGEVADALERFYYVGLHDVLSYEPVVHFNHYGQPLGQIRLNLFHQRPWMLRELHTNFAVKQGQLVPQFEIAPVGNNPFAELYNEQFNLSGQQSAFASQQAMFAVDFTNERLADLLAPELGGAQGVQGCFANKINTNFPAKFNEFQSQSEGLADDPTTLAPQSTTNVQNNIRNRISQFINDRGLKGITVDHVLNRAGAQTCGGCHEFSRGRELSGPTSLHGKQTFPNSFDFTHVNDIGVNGGPPDETPLSSALTRCFLPAREQNLEKFLCERPTSTPTPTLTATSTSTFTSTATHTATITATSTQTATATVPPGKTTPILTLLPTGTVSMEPTKASATVSPTLIVSKNQCRLINLTKEKNALLKWQRDIATNFLKSLASNRIATVNKKFEAQLKMLPDSIVLCSLLPGCVTKRYDELQEKLLTTYNGLTVNVKKSLAKLKASQRTVVNKSLVGSKKSFDNLVAKIPPVAVSCDQ